MGRLGNLAQNTGRSLQWPCVTVDTAPVTPRDRLAGACLHCCRREGLSICSCIVASGSRGEEFCWQRQSHEPGCQWPRAFVEGKSHWVHPHHGTENSSQWKMGVGCLAACNPQKASPKNVHHARKANSSLSEPPFEMSAVTAPVFRYWGSLCQPSLQNFLRARHCSKSFTTVDPFNLS